MVKSINVHKKEAKLILALIIGLLLFQAILPYIEADDLVDGPLDISTPQKSINVSIGNSATIDWSFSVPSHEYAVYWEIIGHGVNKSGWGINANCTIPVVTTNGTIWIYNCSGYYAKYHVWCTVSVIGQEEVSGRDNDGVDGIYAQKVNSNGVNRWAVNGTAICIASGDHKSPQIVSDGAGGAIITWEESNIYTQKVNSDSEIQWDLNGNAICTEGGTQKSPQLVSDGANGTIITWQDSRDGDYDIYAQKVNSSGDIQWIANGTAICTANGSQEFPQLVSDGVGGAIITWQDNRNGDYDIYAQKVNSSGDVQWIVNGTTICTANGSQEFPQLVSEGVNGTIITWQDNRTGDFDIYAQKFNSSGEIQWIANGTAICTANGSQEFPQLVSDGVNGTIITWQDSRDGADDIFIQKVNFSGDVQWFANGTAICTANGDQVVPQLINDGANGTIITWQDSRDGDYDIYAQKVNSSGDNQWTVNGTAICTANSDQLVPQLISDSANGTIITWQDSRDGADDIYAQKVNSNGGVQWTTYGKAICIANGDQLVPQLVSDGVGGAIITWIDNRVELSGGDNGGDNGGDDNGYVDEYDTYIPGFPPFLFIIIFSICVIFKIIIFQIKSKKEKFKK
ncbi:MAG: hypothetical protein V3V33_06535 [Candidatus Lokiarchaeia archaeon]